MTAKTSRASAPIASPLIDVSHCLSHGVDVLDRIGALFFALENLLDDEERSLKPLARLGRHIAQDYGEDLSLQNEALRGSMEGRAS